MGSGSGGRVRGGVEGCSPFQPVVCSIKRRGVWAGGGGDEKSVVDH